ncbi:MAG: hypothetical protein WAW17_14375 [Rhodococcus sp. (in: high G+C Gram-positive bacteria)]
MREGKLDRFDREPTLLADVRRRLRRSLGPDVWLPTTTVDRVLDERN